MQEPSFNQSPPLFGCFFDTLSPSFLQILSILLWFTFQPSCLSSAIILQYPYLPYCVISSIVRATNLCSSFLMYELCLCVVLAWPRTWHARLFQILRVLRTLSTILRLFDHLRSLSVMLPSEYHCLRKDLLLSSWAGHFPSQVLGVFLLAQSSSHRILLANDSKFTLLPLIFLAASPIVEPWESKTSASRSFLMICSGL